MLELENDVLEIKFNGEKFSLNYPTLDDLSNKELTEVSEFKAFFKKLGMPKKVSDSLQISHALKIIEALTEKKN